MPFDDLDPSIPNVRAALEEIASTREELIAAAMRKVAMDQLLRTEGWKYLERYWLERIEGARTEMLAIDTADQAKAIDTLRNWRMLEKQWAEWVSYVNECLSFDSAEEVLMKENVNA